METVKSWEETLKNVSIDLDFHGSEIQLKCFPYDIESIFIKSDTSMYKAKASGGNEVYI